MSDRIDKYIIITFSIVNNCYPCHPYIFVTKNYSSKFMIISCWSPTWKFPAEKGIPKKSQDMSQVIPANNHNVWRCAENWWSIVSCSDSSLLKNALAGLIVMKDSFDSSSSLKKLLSKYKFLQELKSLPVTLSLLNDYEIKVEHLFYCR